MTKIAIEQLSKWYGEVIGVSHISADLLPGVTGLLGPNGAGKTTLFKLLTGLIRPDTGQATVDGQPVWNNPNIYELIGYCPSLERCYDDMTGLEFLMYMGRLNGLNKSAAKTRSLECLEQMGLADAIHKYIGAYSKGMRQRVKFAQAILHDPPVVLLDEPLSGMDPIGRHQTVELIHHYGDQGKTIVVSSHILHEVEEMTPRIILMNNGMLLAEGDIHEIRDLLDQQPRKVEITCDDRRRLSNLLVQLPEVQSISFGEEPDQILVQTKSADGFYEHLNDLVIEHQMPIRHVMTLDDNLQSVFDYLVK